MGAFGCLRKGKPGSKRPPWACLVTWTEEIAWAKICNLGLLARLPVNTESVAFAEPGSILLTRTRVVAPRVQAGGLL